MIYDVRQVTTYAYTSTVPFSRHAARLLPVNRPGQRVIEAALDIDPAPAERSDARDFFGNRLTVFALEQPHAELVVSLSARIEVQAPEPLLASLTPPWEAVRSEAMASADLSSGSPAHFLYPSRSVALDPAITAWTAESFPRSRPILEAATALMTRIKSGLRYQPGATDAKTPPAVAFAAKRGVCQDFAHVMIAGLRGLGLPAAYVSGYLRTDPPPGRPRLQGADATHAWVSVWCGEASGWVGLDPTNGIAAGEDHIVLAIGRDYADVSPLDGVIIASGEHSLTVEVDVVPVPSKPLGRSRPATAAQ
ncbi:transglutaminase family protein [Chthonobacter albigriseus]|uniref:transglutaminase family protein n=1 Tax=Chthonobacter albigriseus TaxID=1683161 RepID=UPI0015EF3E84|nr:transglutaminase family protein [Chthonobacter albigriseus]